MAAAVTDPPPERIAPGLQLESTIIAPPLLITTLLPPPLLNVPQFVGFRTRKATLSCELADRKATARAVTEKVVIPRAREKTADTGFLITTSIFVGSPL